jgi:5-methyltetrahydropteroyltriglutamate--homocysteine methyltransferase
VETPQEVAEVIGKALQFVPRQHLFPCTNCGMAPMDRDIAVAKLKALAQGAEIARKKHAKRGQRPKARNARRRTR